MRNTVYLTIALWIAGSSLARAQTLTPFQNKEGKWGYKNKKGKVKIKPNYSSATKFAGNWAIVSQKGKYGTIDKKDHPLIPVMYAEITPSCRRTPEDPLIIKNNGKYALFTAKGKRITGFVYDWMGEDKSCEGMIPAKKNGREFQLNRLGTATEIEAPPVPRKTYHNIPAPPPPVRYKKGEEIYMIVEKQATPKEGLKKYYEYFQKNMRYPAQAKRMEVEGKVYLQFVVEKDGSLTDIKILKGIGSGCEEEAVRLVKEGSKWNPGKQGGVPVRVMRSIPILFKIKQKPLFS